MDSSLFTTTKCRGFGFNGIKWTFLWISYVDGPLQGSSTCSFPTHQVEDDDPPCGPDDVVEEVNDEDAELGGEGEAEDQTCVMR